MPNIVLLMNRESIVQALMSRVDNNPDMSLIYEPYYNKAYPIIKKYRARSALIEIGETGPYDIEYCLDLCERLRKLVPKCKLILMCPEQDKESVNKVIAAKRDKLIDDFVFYDVTIDYLASKLLSID